VLQYAAVCCRVRIRALFVSGNQSGTHQLACSGSHPDSTIYSVLHYNDKKKIIVLQLITRRRRSSCAQGLFGVSHCNTLQHTATHCSTLQHTATHCSTLQHTAAHCSTLQHTAVHCNTLQHTAAHCSTLQHTATHCNTLQHTAAHCNTLQHTCNALQRTNTGESAQGHPPLAHLNSHCGPMALHSL